MSWSPMTRKGQLTEDGAYATLTFRRVYRHSPQNVWDAIATPEGLRGWLMCSHAVIDGYTGGRFVLVSGPASYRSEGTILVWDPPRMLEYEWNVAPLPEMPRGENAIFRFELTADGECTHLLVTYRRITRETARGFLPGTHTFLDRLEAQLDGRDLPDWMPRFQELQTDYPEWSGHATHTGQ
jgi:uncharacterized protein YndB with AHSA1/START domain